MITTRFTIPAHLAEYLNGKFNDCGKGPISLPDASDLYHLLWDLMARRPGNVSPIDEGNVCILLPDRRAGKDPQYFNYISERAARQLANRVKAMFIAELHQRMDDNHISTDPICFTDVVHLMLSQYDINTISEDALVKNYRRWRDRTMKRTKRRAYTKSQK